MSVLPGPCIFLTLSGSQAHGTAGQGSDLDLRGVCTLPIQKRVSVFQSFEQYEGELPEKLREQSEKKLAQHPTAAKSLGEKKECVIYEFAKFVRLCSAANPNALEILFADPQDWLVADPSWEEFYAQRYLFLSKKVQQTFLGYGLAQLRKIQTHRGWLLDPPKKKPTREEFGLSISSRNLSQDDLNRIEQSLSEKIRSYGLNEIQMPASTRLALQERLTELYSDLLGCESTSEVDSKFRDTATKALNLAPAVVETLNAEKRYRGAMKHWHSYLSWKEHRNSKRAALEAQFGYDTKHAMHLIRLMRMGLETLETGDLKVRRPDAQELIEIRRGAFTFEQVITLADQLKTQIEDAAKSSSLPEETDETRIDQLATTLMLSFEEMR